MRLHHGVGIKWARKRPLIAGWHAVYPAYDVVGPCKRGLLLLLPGFFTDFLGLLLLLPPVQKHLTMKLMPHLRFSRMPGGGFSAGTGGGETFEGEFQRKDEQRDRLDHKDDRRD